MRKYHLERARRLLSVAPSPDDDQPADLKAQPLCPCCGGTMIIIEVFERRYLPRAPPSPAQIGRASCRVRLCKYVSISVVAVSFKTKTNLTIHYLILTYQFLLFFIITTLFHITILFIFIMGGDSTM